MTSSQLCLDLGAAGFSTRFALAVVLGCVPVYLDTLRQAWHGVLPLHRFSVAVSREQMERNLTAVVGAIGDVELARLRAGLALAWPAFVWSSFEWPEAGEPRGAWAASDEPDDHDAFAVLMAALGRRCSGGATAGRAGGGVSIVDAWLNEGALERGGAG